jgi:hypothetical protein
MRIVLARALSSYAVRFAQAGLRQSRALALPLARVARSEQHERSLVTSLWPPSLAPLETAAAAAQAAVEIDAALAVAEADPYVAQALRLAMLEHVDHVYRLDALSHRLTGRGLDALVLDGTEVQPGRPAWHAHRDPADDLRVPVDRRAAQPMTRVASTIAEALCTFTRETLTEAVAASDDPLGRQLLVELASIEDQHVTQLASLHDPDEGLLEAWLLLEASEACAYYGSLHHEHTSGLKAVWDRLLTHELGQLQLAAGVYRREHGREPEGVIPLAIADPLRFEGHGEYVRRVLREEANLTAYKTSFVDRTAEMPSWPSVAYRQRVGAGGWPSQEVVDEARDGLDLAAE